MKAYKAIYRKSFEGDKITNEWDKTKYFSELHRAIEWMEEKEMNCYYDGITQQDYQSKEMYYASKTFVDNVVALLTEDNGRYYYIGKISIIEIN